MVILQGIPSAVIDTITRKLGLQTAVERSTFELINAIQPVIQADEKFINVVAQRDGAGSIMTTDADRAFFLTDFTIAASSIAATAAGNCTITAILESGESVKFGKINYETTAEITSVNRSMSLSLSHPIKLKKGTSIAIEQGGTGGAMSATVYGYIEDN